MAGEEDLFRALNTGFTHPALDALAIALDVTALWYVLAIVLIPLWMRRRRTLAFDLLVALGVVILVTEALKFAVGRPRPYEVYAGVRVVSLGLDIMDPAFPSGHTSRAFAVAALLGLHERRWVPLLLPWAALVGWARIYQGVHYPSDVLGGALLGLALGFAFYRIDGWPPYARLRERLVGRWLSPGPEARPGSSSPPPPGRS